MTVPLPELQRALLDAVEGPGCDLPAAWFAGDLTRAALGVSAHATTIRHARADALGQSFPRTVAHLGTAFPRYAEAYLSRLGPTRMLPHEIGRGFPSHLAWAAQRDAAAVASVEWAALQSLHAADLPTLDWNDVRNAADPLEMCLALHPAAAVLPANPATMRAFDLDPADATAILISRPELSVFIRVCDRPCETLARAIGRGEPLGRAAAEMMERTGASSEASSTAFAALVTAGALVLKDRAA